MYLSQINILYTLNLYHALCQIYLNKTEKKIKNVYTCTMECYPVLKWKKSAACDNMKGFGRHYAKWNKQNTEGQILYDIIYI